METKIFSPSTAQRTSSGAAIEQLLDRVRYALPEGRALPEAVWRQRHRAILVLLWLQAAGIVVFGVLRGYGLVHSLTEGSFVAVAALLAIWPNHGRRFQSAAASLGLVTSSALFVHLSGGFIEMHFHFFVMVIIISLYQDWVPFLLAIGFVVIHHGVLGMLDPVAVFNHPDAWAEPWKWAGIHGAFVLAASLASVVNWRLSEQSRAQAELILSSAGEGIYGLDLQGNIEFVNPATTRIIGWEDSELIGRRAHDMLHGSQLDGTSWPRALCPVCAVLDDGQVHRGADGHIRKKDGSVCPVEYISTPMRERSKLSGTVVSFKDITERRRGEAALQQANQQLTLSVNELERHSSEIKLLNNMGELLQSCLDVDEAYRVIAQSAGKLFPAEAGALYMFNSSRNLLEAAAVWGESQTIMPTFAPQECWALRRGLAHAVSDGQVGLLCQHVAASGQAGASYLCVPMIAQGDAIGVLHLRSGTPGTGSSEASAEPRRQLNQQLAVTVAEQSASALANLKLRESLRQQSIRDPLTRLFNRRYLEETLEREMSRAGRKSTALAVIMIDVDHFKDFNDTYGHAAGDAVLRDLGQLMHQHVRGDDIASRYGGEEFALVLAETPLSVALERAEELREAGQRMQVEHRGQTLGSISLSFGVAVFPEHGDTPETVLQAADVALYRAKRGGRNQVLVSAM